MVITDIAMPGEDGHTLVRRLNDSDFAEYLTKPIDPLVLAQAVRGVRAGFSRPTG